MVPASIDSPDQAAFKGSTGLLRKKAIKIRFKSNENRESKGKLIATK